MFRESPRVAVAVLPMLLLAAACTQGAAGPSAPSGPSMVHELVVLWPEQSAAAAARTQALADEGDPSVSWRLDPRVTAERFAAQVLGWRASRVVRVQTWRAMNGLELARVWLCLPGGCPQVGPAFHEEVVLKRAVRRGPGGIWSITEVNSGRLQLSGWLFLRVRDVEVPAGHRVHLFTQPERAGGLPEGTRVLAGSVSWGPCGTLTESAATRLWFQGARFQVATQGCGTDGSVEAPAPGYVFALRAPEAIDPAGVAAGLFDPTRPREDEAPILDLTAAAVRFVPRDGPIPRAPPDWLQDDPRAYPTCRPGELRPTVPSFHGVPGGGVAITVVLRHQGAGPCEAQATLRLTIERASGHPLRIAGNGMAIAVRGSLPRQDATAGWWLRSWCRDGPIGTGIVFRLSGLRHDVTFMQPFLRVPCTATTRSGAPRLLPAPGRS